MHDVQLGFIAGKIANVETGNFRSFPGVFRDYLAFGYQIPVDAHVGDMDIFLGEKVDNRSDAVVLVVENVNDLSNYMFIE